MGGDGSYWLSFGHDFLLSLSGERFVLPVFGPLNILLTSASVREILINPLIHSGMLGMGAEPCHQGGLGLLSLVPFDALEQLFPMWCSLAGDVTGHLRNLRLPQVGMT